MTQILEKFLENLRDAKKAESLNFFAHNFEVMISRHKKFFQDLRKLPQNHEIFLIIFEIFLSFKDKIFEFFISKGQLFDRRFLLIFGLIYPNARRFFDARFLKMHEIAMKSFKNSTDENEKILLLELAFLCRFCAGDALCKSPKSTLQFFIQNVLPLDIHAHEIQHSHAFLLAFFDAYDFPFDDFSDAVFQTSRQILNGHFSSREIRNIFNTLLQIFWNVPQFFNDKKWLDFFEIWCEIFLWALKNDMENAAFLHFFLYHICGNNFVSQLDWENFNEKITKISHGFYKKFARENFSLDPKNSQNSVKKIGFLRDRLVQNSPFKVEFSFIKMLAKTSDFDVKIYLLSVLEKSANDTNLLRDLLNLGVKIFDVGTGRDYVLDPERGVIFKQIFAPENEKLFYNSHLQKAKNLTQIIFQDKIDVLISPNNGYGICDLVLAARPAPLQLFWSHGNFAYDAPCIDKKITHICGNQEKITHFGREFFGVPVKMDANFYNPPVDFIAVKNHKKNFTKNLPDPEHAVILGSIGRLVKSQSDAFLRVLVEILRQNKNTVFLACGGGNFAKILEKIEFFCADSRDFSKISSRVFAPGYVDSALFGHVIDFWADSFPSQHGESRIEFAAKDKLSLVMSSEPPCVRENGRKIWLKNHENFLRQILKNHKNFAPFADEKALKIFIEKNADLVAFDEKDYEKKANFAIKNLSDPKPEAQDWLKKQLFAQKIIRETNDLAKEILGVEFFKKICEF